MFNRIAIIGGAGTGKTTLANKLSEVYGIQAIYIDGIHHLPNWKIRDKDERDKIILDYVSQDKWIIDGTYHKTLKQRLDRADLIIWLDYPTHTQLKGVLKRYIKNRGKEKEEILGCKEKMDFDFLKCVLFFRRDKRIQIVDALKDVDMNKVIVFKKQKHLNAIIKIVNEKEKK